MFYLLRNKTHAAVEEKMNEYLAWCTSVGVAPKWMPSDNANELTDPRVKSKLASMNIRLTTSSARVPRQNGVIEKRWRILSNDTRTILNETRLPTSWCWYLVQAHSRVSHCLPDQRPRFHGHTPWSLFTGKRP
mmetsp:Transcript_19544/g.42106  ORF Transcript_19544/g.42106 Transcript_19544/m.42106 type:complete len:133 (-) Transcript_19544:118-516(-)